MHNTTDKKARLKVMLRNAYDVVGWPLIATFLGLLVGVLVMLLAGSDPLEAYSVMLSRSFFGSYYFLQTLTRAIPIMLCGMAAATAWRAGYPNIGMQGQMTVGGFAAAVIALYLPGPSWLVVIVSILGGSATGMLYALLPAVLNWKCDVSLIISTLMLSFAADNIVSYLVAYPFLDPEGDKLSLQTAALDSELWFGRVFSENTFHVGFFLAAAIVIIMTFVLKKSVFGYESKIAGLNPSFAKYGGVRQTEVMLITMALSGALAGLAGSIEVFGVKHRYVNAMFADTGYAWTGIMAAMIAQLNPIVTFVYSIFLSGLEIGGQGIQRALSIPLEIARIIQCAITIFASIRITFQLAKPKKRKEKKAADGLPDARRGGMS